MKPTQRSYKDIETDKEFRLYMDDETHDFELIYEKNNSPQDMANGTSVNGFYLAPFNSIDVKINNKKIITIPAGYFYNLKEDEIITHKRYTRLQKRFSKLKN